MIRNLYIESSCVLVTDCNLSIVPCIQNFDSILSHVCNKMIFARFLPIIQIFGSYKSKIFKSRFCDFGFEFKIRSSEKVRCFDLRDSWEIAAICQCLNSIFSVTGPKMAGPTNDRSRMTTSILENKGFSLKSLVLGQSEPSKGVGILRYKSGWSWMKADGPTGQKVNGPESSKWTVPKAKSKRSRKLKVRF